MISIFLLYLFSKSLILDNSDSLSTSLLNRVYYRDSISNAILAVKYLKEPAESPCLTSYLSLDIQKTDSGYFLITLSPKYSGCINGCFVETYKEAYLIKFNDIINTEYKYLKQYDTNTIIKWQTDSLTFSHKSLKITGHILKLNSSICDIFDSLGTSCKVRKYHVFDTILEVCNSGVILFYNKYLLTFNCCGLNCTPNNIYSNQDLFPDNIILINPDHKIPLINLFLKDCENKNKMLEDYYKKKKMSK
jgi:hypothetical protein